ncbi:hypothetical protein BFJ63_vAg3565 [Fusarium oxysporum f. sp. narcissi]|uniref:Uncharacterized protein n=1 Tax=Fusarium oxysporum f. sp. narcissi TaxID=451672 RepID=A0A4Q2W2X1_FUSOX|nr:hypothetical protein BFJ63_vAg3565 [Fusarium oxysporum f. sp. narcissi]
MLHRFLQPKQRAKGREQTMSRHGPVPVAAFESGPIPFWSEAFLMVDCPYLHLVEPGWPPLTKLTQSPSDSSLFNFAVENIALCPKCGSRIHTVRRLPLSLDSRSGQPTPPELPHPHIPELPAEVPFGTHSRLSPSRSSPGAKTTRLSPGSFDLRSESEPPIPPHTSRQVLTPQPESSLPIPVDPTIANYAPCYVRRPDNDVPLSSDRDFNSSAVQVSPRSHRWSFLTRFKRPKPDAASSILSMGNSGDIRYLSFCFSSDGVSILLWEKNSLVIARLNAQGDSGRLIDLIPILRQGEGGQAIPGSTLFVAEGCGMIAAIVSQGATGKFLVVLDHLGLAERSAVLPLQDMTPLCLAISRCNSFVAVGLAARVLLVRLTEHKVDFDWAVTISIRGPSSFDGMTVASETCNFTADGRYLIVATQMRDKHQSSEDGSIHTALWTCEREAKGPFRLPCCKMPNDDQGLTSIQFHHGLQVAAITGLTSARYPLFLSLDPQQPVTIPAQVTDFRIRCSCMAPPPQDHLMYFLDASNRVCEADLHHRHVELVADITTYRGSLRSHDEPAAIAVGPGGIVEVFWRQGPGLWRLQFRPGEEAILIDNLRRRWDETI